MFEKVLIPTDFTDEADRVLAFVTGMTVYGVKEVVLVHVVDTGRTTAWPMASKLTEKIEKRLEERREIIENAGIRGTTLLLEGTPSAEVLRMTAQRDGFSLIVSGSHGKLPMEEMFFGSVSEAVARSCKVPILLLRYEMLKEAEEKQTLPEYAASTFRKVLFPSDFTDSSDGAQKTLADLKKLGAEEVVTLHVVDTKRMETETESKELLDNCYEDSEEIADDLHKRTFKVSTVCKTGDPVNEILGTADEVDATLIIMGSHGKGLIREWLDGSVSLSVLRQADRPVMVVHPAA